MLQSVGSQNGTQFSDWTTTAKGVSSYQVWAQERLCSVWSLVLCLVNLGVQRHARWKVCGTGCLGSWLQENPPLQLAAGVPDSDWWVFIVRKSCWIAAFPWRGTLPRAVLAKVHQDWVRMFTVTLIVMAEPKISLLLFIKGLTSKISVCSYTVVLGTIRN